MYNFIDVNEASESVVLPSEALKINGEYIENQIVGYRTLHVSGREALSPELSIYETGIRDGSTLKSKRFPARTIIVTYQIIAESSEAFREAYNQLAAILNVEDAELIFNDEQDKFFVGTPSVIGEVEPGKNCVTGEFEILCTDPFKYSVIEYEAKPALDETSILIDYNGTYKAFPTLEAEFYNEEEVSEDGERAEKLTGNGDCGFVAFFNEDEKIIQLGDPDEHDGTNAYAKSQTLLNQTFKNKTSWGTAAKGLWVANSGKVIPGTVLQSGTVGMGIASYEAPANPAPTSGTLITATSRAGAPVINYKVTAKTSGRTANSVKVAVAITGSLGADSSYFLTGYGLKASLYIGGAWRSVTLKKTTDQWRGRTGHTANLSFTVTGLSATTSKLVGIKFKVERTDKLGTAGVLNSVSCSNLAISQYVADVPETYYLHATNYGSASGKWHGASITRNLPIDAAGEWGATNFTLTYKQKMCIGSGKSDASQIGAFQVQVSDANNNNVAGLRILKNKTGRSASLVFYLNGVNVYTGTIDLSYNNKYFGSLESSVQTSKITKSGSRVTFSTGGVTKTFIDEALSTVKVRKVMFMFEQYSTTEALTYNGLYWAKFVKNNCNTFKDVPNKFSANDIVTANCKNGEIYLNGVHSPELGALGNDWEDFCLNPGLNQIGFAYSDWVPDEYAPTVKVRYREVFL
jgi:predicted phage tail component-like protein